MPFQEKQRVPDDGERKIEVSKCLLIVSLFRYNGKEQRQGRELTSKTWDKENDCLEIEHIRRYQNCKWDGLAGLWWSTNSMVS